jgi:alginate O-acetyltransferase complex protein AlgI
MPFNSISFLGFLLLSIVAYSLLKSSKSRFNYLSIVSLLFYLFSGMLGVVCLIITILVTFFAANVLKKSTTHSKLLLCVIPFLIIQLILVKYADFILAYLNIEPASSKYLFVIGISFYTLQAIGLLVDIKKGKYEVATDLKSITLFLSFFPQSVCGPIHRGDQLIPQFSNLTAIATENLVIGIKTVMWGFFCKLIVADKIFLIIGPIFDKFHQKDGLTIFFASLLYSFQIYFDFWGYSLIALGLGRIFGIKININFNEPYRVTTFREFWHRWHISFSTWLRDYIYIPLGGNRHRLLIYSVSAIFITFLISGLWHGVGLNFLLWGFCHAFIYMLEKYVFTRIPALQKTSFLNINLFPLRYFVNRILFFITLSFTWLIFRTENLDELASIFKSIFSFGDWSPANLANVLSISPNSYYLIIIVITLLISNSIYRKSFTDKVSTTFNERIRDGIFMFFMLALFILLADIGGAEFLYFRF